MLGIYYVFSFALSFSHFYPMHPVQKYNNNRLRERSKVFGINLNIFFIPIGLLKLCPCPNDLLIAPKKKNQNTHTQVR